MPNSSFPLVFAGGAISVVRGYAYPDRDAAGRVQGAFVMLLDITRERAFEAELQGARDEAVEANRSKSRFLAAASHDLRQPLHAMTLFVNSLNRRLAGTENGELIAHVDQSLRSLRSMIDALLDMSKIEAGLIKANSAPIRLQDFFETLKPGFLATARDKKLEFRIVGSKTSVIADPTLLELALRNLLANAMKFTRTGGVLLGVRRGRGRNRHQRRRHRRRHRRRARRARCSRNSTARRWRRTARTTASGSVSPSPNGSPR